MSGFDFDKSGTFGSEKAADDYAKRNKLSVQDYQLRQAGDGVELKDDKLHDTGESRKWTCPA